MNGPHPVLFRATVNCCPVRFVAPPLFDGGPELPWVVFTDLAHAFHTDREQYQNWRKRLRHMPMSSAGNVPLVGRARELLASFAVARAVAVAASAWRPGETTGALAELDSAALDALAVWKPDAAAIAGWVGQAISRELEDNWRPLLP